MQIPIGEELERFLSETPDHDILDLYRVCHRAEYDREITVSDYMDAIGHEKDAVIGNDSE